MYWRLIGAHTRSQMQYKASFVLRTLGTFTGNLFDFAGIAVLFSRVPQLAGWTLPEVALLFGMSAVSFATAEMLGGALDDFDTVIRQGTFDRILIRPVATVYVALLPEDGRDAIRRLLDNMKEPSLFFNNVLQGEFERAGITLGRFTANTSLGLVGIFDVAAMWGLRQG